MNQFEIKGKFTTEFFEEFQYDAEFRAIFFRMEKGMTPYEAIECLCKSKKKLFKSLEEALANQGREIIILKEDKLVK